MIRKAFIMAIKPGAETDYIRHHQPIWPKLAACLKTHGAHNYSIFLNRATQQLFAYVEIEDEARWAAIAHTEVCQRWWKFMAPLMVTDDQGRPAAHAIEEAFHLP
jgi:L-rhamnose mutarotase